VLEVSEYFERLDVRPESLRFLEIKWLDFFPPLSPQSIQTSIRSSLAHIRQSRIAPSAINAPRSDFIPPPLGAGLPSEGSRHKFGLQEERVERDAWNAILSALTKLQALQSSHDDTRMDTRFSQ